MTADYQCSECKHWFDHFKRGMQTEWPKDVECPACGAHAGQRGYKTTPYTHVAEGKQGNAANGYQTQIAYKPSPFTPKKSGWSDIDSKDGSLWSVKK
jgi:DNA-directed RNA polymerase subunit RPC12/RpoP